MTALNCEDVRPLIEAYVDGELASVRAASLEAHVAGCPACSAALGQQRGLRAALRSRAPYHRAPPGLLEGIVARTTRPEGPSNASRTKATGRVPSWQRWALPLAASLVLAILIDSSLQFRRAGDRLAGEILDAHVRSLMAEHLADVPSTDQHTVKPWFADKLDFSPPVRDLAANGFPLAGGRLDFIDHHPVAALIYRHRLHVINVFIWPSASDRRSAPTDQTREGFNLVHWRADGMELWAVSDLNADELDQFVHLLQLKNR